MGVPVWVPLLVVAVATLAFVGIGTALVLTFTAAPAPLPADPGAVLVRHGRIRRAGAGGWRGDTDDGALRVTPTHLEWHPRAGAPWATPIPSVTILGSSSAWALGDPAVEIHIHGSGTWLLRVSDRSLNRFVENDAKRFREARAARQFAGLLLARGARTAALPYA